MPPDAVTLLFTDMEGSTRLARRLGAAWPEVVADHHRIVASAIEAHDGHVERVAGDSFFALFDHAAAAAAAAVEAQRALAAHDWPVAAGEVSVRMGLHTGAVDRSAGDLTGLDIHLAARVEAAAHGGQIVLTAATRDAMDGGFEVADLGEHRLKDFPAAEHLFLLAHDDRGPADFPPLRTEAVRPTNLPAEPRRLLGRERELDALWDMLGNGDERLVTLLGLGGAGKTRLALAAGEGLLSSFAGGVWLVRLAGVDVPEAIVPAIADAVGVGDAADRPLAESVVERLRRRPTLLVLDNFEHLVDGAAIVAELLAKAPRTRALVTSQLPLRLAAERVVRLAPLASDAAVSLFAERAEAGRPGFDLDADREAVEAICARVEGLPLAVELAAARVAVLPPHALLTRLDSSFAVLGQGPRDAPERHRSLRATLEWAHALLQPTERTLLARLAVFAGPAPLDAVEAVAEVAGEQGPIDGLDALSGLLDASLVRRSESREHGVRYGVPEAVRDFAAEHLAASGDEDAVRRAHAEHVAALAEAARAWSPGHPDAPRARVAAVEDEQRVALAWTREHAPETHLRLASGLAGVMTRSGRTREAHHELGVALERFAVDGTVAGWAAVQRAYTSFSLGGSDEERPLLERGIATLRAAGDEALLAAALKAASIFMSFTGDADAALAAAEDAVAVQRRRADAGGLAVALMTRAQCLVQVGRLDDAQHALDEGAAIAAAIGDPGLTMATVAGDLALEREDWAAAARSYAESAAASEARACTEQLLIDLQCLGLALAPLGDHEGAIEAAAAAATIEATTGETGIETTDWAERWNATMASARAAAGPDGAAAAAARGRSLRPSERGARALALAEAACAREGSDPARA